MKARRFFLYSVTIVLAASSAHAADFYWDADPGTVNNQNGDGNWNTASTNWTATAGSLTNILWDNDGSHTAFLGNVGGTGYTNASTGGVITLDQTINLTSLSMSSGQLGSYVINGGEGITLNFGASGSIGNNNSNATLTVNAVVSGTSGLNKINSGRVILTGENTYTGNTTLSAGVLEVGTISNGSLGVGGLLFNGGVLQGNGTFTRSASGVSTAGDGQITGLSGGFSAKGGQLTVDLGESYALSQGGVRFGTNFIFGSSSADSLVKLTSNLSFGGNTRTITVNSGTGGDAAEFSGIISNGGSTGYGFTKAGTGLLIFSGDNNNTGVTAINAGTVRAAHNNAFGVSTASVTLGNTGATLELADTINIDRALTVSDTGDKKTLRLQSTATGGTYSGSILVNETAASNFELSSAAGQTLTVSGKISGAGAAGITKVGAGTVVLSAADNNYSGLTTVSQGTLDVGALANRSLGPGHLRLTGGAVLQGNGSFTRVLSNNATPTAGDVSGGNGGFAAKGGTLTVNFGGNGGSVFLSGAGFSNRFGDNFVFGSETADSKVVVVNPLVLNGSNRNFTVNSGAGGDSAELTGVISHAVEQNVGFNKMGTGLLTLSAANTYTGTTNIVGGTLALSATGSINNSATIIVGANTTFDVSAVNGGYTLAAGQTLSGTGTVIGSSAIVGTLSPGNSPGTLNTGSQTWLDGGDYNWQIVEATGNAGTGYDTISMNGTLDLSNLTEAGFAINLWSLASTGPDVNGDATNFNNSLNQSWTLLTASGGITGFDASDFALNVAAMNGTSGFSNALADGAFSIATSGNNLVLNFAAVPEPASVLLAGLSAFFLLRRRRSA